MYEWLTAEAVFDPSCGWGDRLAGFYASSTTKIYFGCDPHGASFELYKQQCRQYEEWLGCEEFSFVEGEFDGHPYFRSKGKKFVTILNAPFEDVNWARAAEGRKFDLVFTSPPYYGIEYYAKGEPDEGGQTWARYEEFEDWWERFFTPLLEGCFDLAARRGVVALNIADTVLRPSNEPPQHYKVCDRMIKQVEAAGHKYEGAIAMVLKKRPSDNDRMKDLTLINYAEPVWVFTRGGVRELPLVEEVKVE